MTTNIRLVDSLTTFADSCGHEYEFPCGGDVPIPADTETALAAAFRDAPPSRAEDYSELRSSLSFRNCYACVTFGVRMAILAVRTDDIALLKVAMYGLILDNGQMDYRDMLGALAIVEECANRLGQDFTTEVSAVYDLIEDADVRATLDGYLSRSPEMRDVEVMGFTVIDQEEGLCFKSRN